MIGSFSMGVDVGGTKIAYGLFDENKTLVARQIEATLQGEDPADFLRGIVVKIAMLCKENQIDVRQLNGVGIGAPCFIRHSDGHIIKSSNIPTLHNFPARTFLTETLGGIRVELDNDTHAAGLAESRHGAGRGYDSILYCSVSSGIASALIIHKQLFQGSYGFSGESGHMLITPNEGVECACGKRGCFMSWCSGHMIVKHIQNWIANGEKTIMLDLVGGDPSHITTTEIQKALVLSDELAMRAVLQMQNYLSLWLYNLYVFTNINCFVLGGGLLKMGTKFWQGVEERFRALDDLGSPVFFKQVELGDDAGIIGANELLY